MIHCSPHISCAVPAEKNPKLCGLALTKGARKNEISVSVVLHLYVSQSLGIHDRKEVLEVARNADCELSTVPPPPLLNPTSFESTKAFLPLFFTQPEITRLHQTCTLAALFYSMCTHMRARTDTKLDAGKIQTSSNSVGLLFERAEDEVQGHGVLFRIYEFIGLLSLQRCLEI